MSKSDARYPIGQFEAPEHISAEDRSRYIDIVTSAPARLREAVTGLSPSQLATPYREGGWTIRQVVHHVPDSHLNMYIRFKCALTETDPVIKPYDEAAWARLSDSAQTSIETSLALLAALHERWVVLLRGMSAEDWQKKYIHPEYGRSQTL